MNAFDEYFTRKEAGFWQGFKGVGSQQLGHEARNAMVAAGVTGASMAIVPAANKLIGAITKRHDFNQMMELNPQLEDYRSEDPKKFNQVYTSLRNLNPEFGRDPIVAGSFMTRMMDEAGNAGFILSEAARARHMNDDINIQFANMPAQSRDEAPLGQFKGTYTRKR